MHRPTVRQTTLFALVHRADLVLTSRAADTLHRLLLNWPPRAELKVLVIENGILAIIGLSAGALFSLVTTFLR